MKRLIALVAALLSASAGAADFDYGLQAQPVAAQVYAFIGRSEDFSTVNGGNIVNTGFLVGSGGIVVIDSGPSLRYGEQMRRAIGRVSEQPLALVINTHHHPDHFLGNQAFAGTPIAALPATIEGIAGEGNAFAENLFRMSGDWMKGTEVVIPNRPLTVGTTEIAGRRLRLIGLDGHAGADLAVYDEKSGVLFAGDLVFNGRAPTTPHADIAHWLAALDRLEAITREAGFNPAGARTWRHRRRCCADPPDPCLAALAAGRDAGGGAGRAGHERSAGLAAAGRVRRSAGGSQRISTLGRPPLSGGGAGRTRGGALKWPWRSTFNRRCACLSCPPG